MVEQPQRPIEPREREVLRLQAAQGFPPWMKGALVENVELVGGTPREVPHRLRRRPRGFILVGLRARDAVSAFHGTVYALAYKQATATMGFSSDAGAVSVVASFWFW